ncbi:MAG: hypothetical protein ACWA5W_03940, partial [Phycisphaerales bacterium]
PLGIKFDVQALIQRNDLIELFLDNFVEFIHPILKQCNLAILNIALLTSHLTGSGIQLAAPPLILGGQLFLLVM